MSPNDNNENRSGQEGAPPSHPQTGAGHDEKGNVGVPGGADRDLGDNDEAQNRDDEQSGERTPDLSPHASRKAPGHGQSTDVHHGSGEQGDRQTR